jgi:predicted transcriptional regulator
MKNEHCGFVLVADQKYWSRLCARKTAGREIRFFIRKNQAAPIETKQLLFYVKKLHMQIRGTADFVERITGDGEELWSKYGAESLFETTEEYRVFAEGRKKMTFIKFANFAELANPKPKETVADVFGSLVWFRPQYVNQKTAELLTNEV